MITRDHREMEKLFERLKTERDHRPQLLKKVEAMFLAHNRAEEEKVYPTIAEEAGEKEEVHHGADEHHEAEEILDQLKQTDSQSKQFDQLLEKFVSAVKHHVEEEENEVLPALKEAVDASMLRQLGRAFDERRAEEMRKHEEGSMQQIPKQRLYDEAKELGIKGHSNMNKEELVDAIKKEKAKRG
nr:hemerythrin domain-containing protein [Nocardiopsis algeriensis]